MRASLIGLLFLVCTACGPDFLEEISAGLTDHPDPLTTGGSDNLFVISVSEADETFAMNELMLTFKKPGGTATALNYELTVDANGDGRLGVGDELIGIEPGPDILNADEQGSELEIDLMQELGPSRVSTLWTGTWTAQ